MSVFSTELIDFHFVASDKREAITKLAEMVVRAGRGSDALQIAKDVLARDLMGTPQVDGIAIPHARSSGVNKSSVVIARTDGILFDDSEGPVQIILMILVPSDAGDEHIKILSKLARRLIDSEFRSALRTTQDAADLVRLLEGGSAGGKH